MHASRPQHHKASLRNQLLSTDIGNIDVREEVPLNDPQYNNFPPPPPQQQQPQFNNGYQMHPAQNNNNNNQRFNPQHQHPQYMPNQYSGQQNLHPSMPNAPFAAHPQQQYGQPRSRRSSLQSNGSSSFNMQSMNNFFKMNKSKSKFSGGGDDDDDEDGKDVMIDDTGNTMSFDDLSTLRDRGRYGGQSSFDSAPIIPTLATPSSRPPGGGNMSNLQYRKQMTAFKKQAMTNAGKVMSGPDPRAMSLQYGGRNPYLEGPDTRAMSLQGRNPYMGHGTGNGPRAGSMTSQTPFPYQPRTNSLTNQPQNSPRAYSLTTNPYQNRPQMYPQQGGRPPMAQGNNVYGVHPPNQQFAHSGPPNGSPKFGPQAVPIRTRNSAPGIPLSSNQQIQQPNRSSQEFNGPPPFSQRNSAGGYNPSTPTIEEAPSFPSQPNLPQSSNSNAKNSSESITKSTDGAQSTADTSHHYLADNTLNNNDHFDSSGVTYSDLSASQDRSMGMPPKDESTPSPFDANKNIIVNSSLDPGLADQDTPSKLPRTKGLPHLSLLKMRDEDPEDGNVGGGAEKDSSGVDYQSKERVLDTVTESDDAPQRARTPPASSMNSKFNSPIKSPQGTPGRRQLPPSPLKKQNNVNTHRRFPTNNMSISSMSEYSTFSGVSDTEMNDADNNKKIYQLAQNSGTTNDVFVTASQFSLIDNKKLGHQHRSSLNQNYDDYPDTIAEGDSCASDTPKLDPSNQGQFANNMYPNRQSTATSTNDTVRNSVATETASIHSSKSNASSLKGSFRSPKFLKNWSKKRSDKKKNNSFEPVTKPIEINNSSNGGSPVESFSPSTRGDSFTHSPVDTISTNSGAIASNGLRIMGDHNVGKSQFQSLSGVQQNQRELLSPDTPSKISKSFDDENQEDGNDTTVIQHKVEEEDYAPVLEYSQNNSTSQPTSASGTYNSDSTNNTIDTDIENYSDGPETQVKGGFESLDRPGKSQDTTVTTGTSKKLQGSFEPSISEKSSVHTNVKKLNLTVEQLGIMEDKSALVRELELVSKELGDSIRREIKLEDQIRGKDIISSPNLNFEHELREKALLISQLESQLNEERTKRYIAEEHVLLWENGLEPSALEVSYENEKLQSELSNKLEIINKQQAEIESMNFESTPNNKSFDDLKAANKELETVTIPELKNEIEVLNNDRKKLSMLTEKFKLLKLENSDLERRLEEGDQLKNSHSKKLEDELAELKQKLQKKVNRASDISLESKRQSVTTPINSRIKKTFLTELGSSSSSVDVLKPPSPMNGKRITSFSLINVTSPNEK